MRLVLIGPPASGKSRIGKKIARMLGVGFVDTDRLIEKEHGPVPEIFATHGEPHFRSLERAAVVTALATDQVVAFGGGAVLDVGTQRDIAGWPVVLLTVTPEAVESRLGNGRRPLVPDVEAWKAVYAKRADLYRSLADHTADTSSVPTERVASDVVAWLTARADAARPAIPTNHEETIR